MDKLKELLGKGFFPVQLPPGFTSKSYAIKYKKYKTAWEAMNAPSTRAEKFSVARSSYYRRVTSIVNPISFFLLSKEIDKFWPKIQKHYKRSKISLSHPQIDPELRAIKISKFSDLYEAKVTRSTGYRYVLITDISSFFPSVYTHTIPWALHSKAVAKKNKTKNDKYFGNILDSRSMGVQDWQTVGLPIGPDTSHIIAEIIGVAIDLQIKDALGSWPSGFRYVDDFFLFFDTREEAEIALAELMKAISNFELQINPSKTRIIEVKGLVEESWKYSLKKLTISPEKRAQRDDIHNYFEALFSLESRFSDESLIKYGLKQISSYIIKISNWDIFEAYLLKCGFSFPNTLQVIANILSTYHYHGYKLNLKAIERFCNNLVKIHAISDHHSEVSWLLWICKELGLNLRRDVVREIEGTSSSVCALICLDLFNSGVIKTNLRVEYLKQFSNRDSLYSSDWLLSYEAGRRGWLKNSNHDYIVNDKFFGELLKEDISFYDDLLKCHPIFEFKEGEQEEIDLEAFFDRNDRIEDHFDFDEMDEEYFDSSDNDDDEELEFDDF
jgi:reverse transcriptase-like protein